MARLIMCKGLPGSGKTTWACEQVLASEMSQEDTSGWWRRVNKDLIRAEFEQTGWTWSHAGEADVIKERDRLIGKALAEGRTVISDDTNFGKHEAALRALAETYGASFEVKDFTGVPVAVCIERDAKRTGKACVGESVIRNMASHYLKPQEGPQKAVGATSAQTPTFAPYTPDKSRPRAILCDLDGTLAHAGLARNIYDFSTCDKDAVDPRVKYFLDLNLEHGNCKVVFVTGREEAYRDKTETFLAKAGYVGFSLFMRTTGDYRKDWIVKGELFDKNIRDVYNVFLCLDDRDQVVNFYRSLGLTVWQVANGNF